MRPESVDPGKDLDAIPTLVTAQASMRPESVDPGKPSGGHRAANTGRASMRPESVDPGKLGSLIQKTGFPEALQ